MALDGVLRSFSVATAFAAVPSAVLPAVAAGVCCFFDTAAPLVAIPLLAPTASDAGVLFCRWDTVAPDTVSIVAPDTASGCIAGFDGCVSADVGCGDIVLSV